MNVGSHGLSAAQYDALPQAEQRAQDSRWKVLRWGSVEITVYPTRREAVEDEAADAIRVTVDVYDATWEEYDAVPAPELPGHVWRWLDLGALRLTVCRPRVARTAPEMEVP